MLRSTLADFYDELDRKLLSSARQTRRSASSKGQGQRLIHVYRVCSLQSVFTLWKKKWGTLTSERGAEIETPKALTGEVWEGVSD